MAERSNSNERLWKYDVFTSFRGPDVRKGFLSHLQDHFKKSGIYAFKDDRDLKPGDRISPHLRQAIDDSKIHLVNLSKNYASSSWCLDELVHIMQCQKRDTGQVVIPIFYDVNPSDVRHLKGSFGKAFAKHKTRHTKKLLKEWKTALKEIANISGFHWGDANRSEARFIHSVTKEVSKRLRSSYLRLPEYTVGIKSRARRIHELMRFDLNDVQTIGICGMGGIGKTTLAKAAFNDLADRFEGASFLENFGGHSKTPDQGKALFQKQLLSDILKSDYIGSNNMDQALKDRFCNKRVLVVIDDVSDWEQFKSLGISSSCFGPGSRILVTSRDEHILTLLKTDNIYSPEALNNDESLKLVSLHAFRECEPREGFLQLSEKLVKYCGGLPLAIGVLGASLYKRSICEWKNTLERLKQTPNDDIKAKLQISFDSLSRQDKDIFLDISCFFSGMDKDYVSYILDGCKLCPELGLKVLKERCLITVRDNKLMMHDLLRDMGRQISQEATPQNCEPWRRLWDDDVIHALTKNSGSNAIRGLSLNDEDTAVENMDVKEFSNLQKLQLFPKDLRWFCWFRFPLASIPTNLHLENVAVMDLKYSNLKRLWDDREAKPPVLEKLKYLDLSHSSQLTDTPDLSCLPNLEKLLMIDCKSLVRVNNLIGTFQQKLVLLNLKDCTELGELPLEIYKLKSLETLILSGCSKLERLDDALGEMKSLKTLKADYSGLTQIPYSIDQLEKLEVLSLEGCKNLWKNREGPQAALRLPLSLNGLSSLKTLNLAYCNLSDELVPLHIGSLSCLEELDLRGNKFRNLQTDLSSLLSLQILKLDGCSELQSIFSLPKNLRSLSARNCNMLKATPDLSNCSVLQALHLTNCSNLDETPGLDKLETVGAIHMEMCNNIPSIYRERLMQGWAVGANGGVFIPGSVLPNCVSFKSMSTSISFTVPEKLNHVPDGFTFWTRYVSEKNDVMSNYSPKITVKNQTKRDVWIRNTATDQIRMYIEEHIWQGHFCNEDFCLETRDQVEVSVDFGNEVTIRETGLTIAYIKEVIDTPDEQFPLIEQEVDNELIREENQRTHFFSRFAFPRSFSKWMSRLKCNLYYNRTNYFILLIFVLGLALITRPLAILGAAITALSLAFLNDRAELETMTSILGSDNLAWSDEQTRLFLQLQIEEKLKGNVRKQLVNEAGRQIIIEKFYDAFGERHPWKKFGNKFNTCKKQYESFKKLTRNRTGLGFDSTGFIDMSDDWWNERCKEWPGARKIKEKPIANMDLMEQVFGSVYISGDEGWTPQQGEENLNTMIPEDPINESDTTSESRHSVPAAAAQETDATTSSNRPKTSRKRSRVVQARHVVADVIRDSIQSRDQILSHKNRLIENHPEFSCSQLRAMQVLHSLPSIRMWSSLYKASIQHLKQDPNNRQTFLCYEEDENKILYLEFATGESRDA